MAISPQTYAGNVSSLLGQLATVNKDLMEMKDIYEARGGAAGAFTTENLVDTGFDAGQMETTITLINDLNTFLHASGRWAVINKHRGDK